MGINAANLSSQSMTANDWSPVTYSSSASVTFTVFAEANTNNFTVQNSHTYGGQTPALKIAVFTSN
jgi:hypothetical protein